MRDDSDHLGTEYHWHTGDIFRARQFQDLTNGHVRIHGYRIADHAAFELLHPIDLPCLGIDRHVLVNDADAALLGNGDGEACLGDRIHGRRHNGEIDLDLAGQLACKRDIAGQDFRICRHQQHVIECECLFKNAHNEFAV